MKLKGEGNEEILRRRKIKQLKKLKKLNGICIYLRDKGLTEAKDQHDVIRLYIVYMQWETHPTRPVLEASVKIQKDFQTFINWFHENIN